MNGTLFKFGGFAGPVRGPVYAECMDRIDEINLQRVRWCCDEAGIEPDDLSDALGISHVTIEKFLQGECGLNFNQLQKMAGFFDRGMLFFLNPKPVDESRVLSPHCRTLANQKPDVTLSVTGWVRKVERQREIYLSLREELDAPVPKVRFPKVNARKPAEAAQIIRKWLGLGDRADFDTFRNAIEAKHILVFRSNGYAGDWQIPKNSPVIGFSLYYEQCPVIVVKKQRWESRQNFTLLHELAHLILHQESMMDEESDLLSHETKEREANQFAGCLLVPDRFLDRIPIEEKPEHAGRYDDWLKPCRTQWGGQYGMYSPAAFGCRTNQPRRGERLPEA